MLGAEKGQYWRALKEASWITKPFIISWVPLNKIQALTDNSKYTVKLLLQPTLILNLTSLSCRPSKHFTLLAHPCHLVVSACNYQIFWPQRQPWGRGIANSNSFRITIGVKSFLKPLLGTKSVCKLLFHWFRSRLN